VGAAATAEDQTGIKTGAKKQQFINAAFTFERRFFFKNPI
jgi:hypothetical protein